MRPLPRLLRYAPKAREGTLKLHFYLESISVVGRCLIAKAHLMVMLGVSSAAYQNSKQTLSPFRSLRRA